VTRVKICGITNLDDALLAAESGADAIGFVFAPSPRKIPEERAAIIRNELPPFVSVVGIFVEPEPRWAREVFDEVGLDFVQLYGGDEQSFLEGSGLSPRRLIRSVSIGSKDDLDAINETSAGYILLDTKVEGKAGGAGKTFDWNIAAAASAYGRPIILAGGLNPDNVAEAIRVGAPQAVDVSSGVESSPGKKDPDKVREFIRRAKQDAT
jgi:phosphoribosylanthranilate isomerase